MPAVDIAVSLDRDPLECVAALAASGRFERYVAYERPGEHLFAGGAVAEIEVDARHVRGHWPGGTVASAWTDDPLRQVDEVLAALPPWQRVYGWMAFEFAAARTDPAFRDSLGDRPLVHLVVPAVEVRFTEGVAQVSGADPALVAETVDLLAVASSPAVGQARPVEVRSASDETYLNAVRTAVSEIRAGEYQKVILSREVEIPFPVDLPATYLSGRANNTPARSFLLDLGGWQAVGFSPETVLEVDAAGRVSTQPLAGTRALGRGAAADSALRAELGSDPKEIFEHAISVKIAYDELLPLCEPGSVNVGEFMSVRRRGSVQHLASRVHGRLRADRTAWDALQELFPAVTASGVPKPAAYSAIARLEDSPRGLYAGAVLVASADGGMDAALVLRALFRREGRTWLRAGAGIVGDSRPSREHEETCEKLGSVAPYVVGQVELAAG